MSPPFQIEHPRAAALAPMVALAVRSALAAVQPAACIGRHLRLEGEVLHAGAHTIDLSEVSRIRVFGAGKASIGLAQALLELLGERIHDGIVITKHVAAGAAGSEPPGPVGLGPIEVRVGSHPLPDDSSVTATREIVERLRDSKKGDLVLCPISGGASALLCEPGERSLDALRTRTLARLAGGAAIHEINEERRADDDIKAGGLASAAGPARVLGLLLSDVTGDPPRYIGSGPTVPDRPREGVDNIVIGRNSDAQEAVASALQAEGFATAMYRDPLVGEARETGARFARVLAHAQDGFPVPRPGCLIAGGETTVTLCESPGVGGRNQEFATAAIQALAGKTDVALLTLGTDGEDGPTRAAGGLVTDQSLEQCRAAGLVPSDHLLRNDSHALLSAIGALVQTGRTGTNVGDLALGFVF